MKIKKWVITTFTALTFSTLIGATNQQVEASTYNSVRVTGSVVNVRTGTSTQYAVIAKVKKGQTFKVYSKRNGWVQIEVNGKRGWLTSQYTADVTTQQNLTAQAQTATYNSVRVTGSVVNVRSGTSTQYAVIAKVKNGQIFKVYAKKNGWVQIEVSGKKGWITSQYTADVTNQKNSTSNQTSRSASRTGGAVVVFAKKQLGKKYVWGATGPSTFDCSGFTTYVMKNFGVSLNRVSAAQASNGVAVSRSQLEQGDLVFFHTTRSGISHVGIYIGGGQFIHASSSAGKVVISSMSSGYYNERFVTARRVIR